MEKILGDEPLEKRITLQSIAEQFNTTKVTVSKAINNQPGVSAELRKKIVQYAYEAGYSKKNGKPGENANTFAFIVQHKFFTKNDSFYSVIFNHLNMICQENGLKLLLFIIQPNQEDHYLASTMNSKEVNGLFIGGEIDEINLHSLLNLGIPTVYIDFINHHYNRDSILVDNFDISFAATSYLIDLGHKEIGFVGNNDSAINIVDRYFGYRKALIINQLPYNEAWTLHNYNIKTSFYDLDVDLPDVLPTAFVCHCDMSAYFFIQKLNSVGINVPEDISVISFDNTLLAESCSPALTSVNISKEDFATIAFKTMKNRLNRPNDDFKKIFLNTSIIKRDSVKQLH